MKLFNPKEYRSNRNFIRGVKGQKLFTFFLSKVSTLEPFDEHKRPWKKTRKIKGVQHYETNAIIDFVLPDGVIVRVPSGFEWDGASIPFLARWLIGRPMGDYSLAALLHDWFYSSKILGSKGRKKADELFLLAMNCLDISWWKRKAMYQGVRIGGFKPYKNESNVINCRILFAGISKYNPWGDYIRHFRPFN